jgi:MFS family permease
MPGIIKAVIGDIDERHAGLAAGMVMTAVQISSALGVAIVGGAFYAILGKGTDIQSYAHAFSDAMALNVALLAWDAYCLFLITTHPQFPSFSSAFRERISQSRNSTTLERGKACAI